MKQATRLLSLFCLASASVGPAYAGFGDTDSQRAERWTELRQGIFGDRAIKADPSVVTLDSPERAQDAALVPIAMHLSHPDAVKGLYLIIDENPSPVAAHFSFGPAMDASTIRLRVRVNAYTTMHAVAEMKDGSLVETANYVKASGGCSAPMGISDEEALKGVGQMKLKTAASPSPGKPIEATLMIRHPNFNGMQMDPITRDYTPARYIQTVDVSFGGAKVFDLATDISLASNPVIAFAMRQNAEADVVKVDVKDSLKGEWSKTFDLRATN